LGGPSSRRSRPCVLLLPLLIPPRADPPSFSQSQLIPLQRKRELGFSFVRLLPKETGVRPIVNLARRPLKIGVRCVSSLLECVLNTHHSPVQLNGQKEVGQPINKVLQGVFDVLTFEKVLIPLFSPEPALTLPFAETETLPRRLPRLRSRRYLRQAQRVQDSLARQEREAVRLRRSMFDRRGADHTLFRRPKLYFVKVDVRACFDTIQQDKLLKIVEDILSEVRSSPPSVLSSSLRFTSLADRVLDPEVLEGHASWSTRWKAVQTTSLHRQFVPHSTPVTIWY
jgi:hypothetical protein